MPSMFIQCLCENRPSTPKPPDIFILDLDAEFASADEVKFRIRALLAERPNSKASVTLLFLSAPLLLRKFLHGWLVISLFDPFNEGESDVVGR